MIEKRRQEIFATSISAFERSGAKYSAMSDALRHGATSVAVAPIAVNGCFSDISSAALFADTLLGSTHDYIAAMKNYAGVYEEYQAYLMPAEHTLAHDYDIAVKTISDFGYFGCLNADLVDSMLHGDDVSDDDVENLGYMGWVHH